jgi:DMSO/TMAO reductase YedYZ molybdopterin-dependent catalytic subunit
MAPSFSRIPLVVLVLAAILLLYVADIGGVFYGVSPGGNATQIPRVEVREYQGKPLSPVVDIRPNNIGGIRHIDPAGYRLRVDGLVSIPKSYSYDEVVENHTAYKKVVTLHCVDGWDATILWEGVLVTELLNESVVMPGATTVIFYADDGFSSSLPLQYLTDRGIIMAYRVNNITLPFERGFPFQLVAEDRWGYKWVKWITRIQVSNDTTYRGYWEQRGFSQGGDLNASFFG